MIKKNNIDDYDDDDDDDDDDNNNKKYFDISLIKDDDVLNTSNLNLSTNYENNCNMKKKQ
jgi:hypothetical protein